ncbi:MAG: organic hydroperoxide resistance protein [Bacteroidota bacterium]
METTTQLPKVLYRAKTHTTGGREHGVAKSPDGILDIKLSIPGTGGTGTNPEQLFAAGWSACFEGAMKIAANRKGLSLPEDTAIDAEVDLCADKGEYYLRARLNVSIPGVERNLAQQIIDASRRICPYSKAVAGNIEAEFNLV